MVVEALKTGVNLISWREDVRDYRELVSLMISSTESALIESQSNPVWNHWWSLMEDPSDGVLQRKG